MLLGIDVGGTTTDAVLTDGMVVVAEAAVPTPLATVDTPLLTLL